MLAHSTDTLIGSCIIILLQSHLVLRYQHDIGQVHVTQVLQYIQVWCCHRLSIKVRTFHDATVKDHHLVLRLCLPVSDNFPVIICSISRTCAWLVYSSDGVCWTIYTLPLSFWSPCSRTLIQDKWQKKRASQQLNDTLLIRLTSPDASGRHRDACLPERKKWSWSGINNENAAWSKLDTTEW